MVGRSGPGRLGKIVAVAALGVAIVLLFGALPSASTSTGRQVARPGIILGPGFSNARVFWNGQNVSGANSAGSAVAINKGQTVPVLFEFNELAAGRIHQASLQLTYLGVVLTTSTAGAYITGGPPIAGAAMINWSFGALSNALQGVFELKASLQNSTGVTVWNETFYVFAKTPYLLESGAVAVLLILVVVEAYWIASALREARKGARPPPPTAWTPPASPGTSGTAPPAATGPIEGSPGSPPPSSGGAS